VLSNTGLKGQNYTVTIPMPSTWKSGTEFTDIIGCGKVKVASTGDFVTNIVNGMPQVSLPFRPWTSVNSCRSGIHRPHCRIFSLHVVYLLETMIPQIQKQMQIHQLELMILMVEQHIPLTQDQLPTEWE
jgi:hypothetical protein